MNTFQIKNALLGWTWSVFFPFVLSGTQVRLGSEDGSQVDVVGLDHNGFLQVYSEEQGLVSLEPDGNSFDMLKNLIVIKHR